jgi:hypothetical protein
VLRTKVGDCNEHTALYVAMARSIGIPARIAVGLTYVRGVTGAFYYHAWPEVYIDDGGRPRPVAARRSDAERVSGGRHALRLARGGLDKQAAILPLIGRFEMTVLDMKLADNTTPILVGAQSDLSPMQPMLPPPSKEESSWLGRWFQQRASRFREKTR